MLVYMDYACWKLSCQRSNINIKDKSITSPYGKSRWGFEPVSAHHSDEAITISRGGYSFRAGGYAYFLRKSWNDKEYFTGLRKVVFVVLYY